jgi:hypothetical protein
MEELNITEEIVVRESINIAEDILGRMNSTGFLEQRIRQQLQPFYETKEVQAIFN